MHKNYTIFNYTIKNAKFQVLFLIVYYANKVFGESLYGKNKAAVFKLWLCIVIWLL